MLTLIKNELKILLELPAKYFGSITVIIYIFSIFLIVQERSAAKEKRVENERNRKTRERFRKSTIFNWKIKV